MKPARVLDLQVELYQWFRTVPGTEYLASFIRHSMKNGEDEFIRSVGGGMLRGLGTADTYWISEATTAVIDRAAEKMPAQALRAEHDLPSRVGFMWLERPLIMTDRKGENVACRLVLWVPALRNLPDGTHDTAVMVFWFVDALDPIDVFGGQLRQEWDTERLGHLPRYTLYHISAWTDGATIADAEMPDVSALPVEQQEQILSTGVREHRWLQAMWSWMQQRVPHVAHQTVDRHTERRFERSMGSPSNGVKVVTLRRELEAQTEPASEPREVNWTHRWMVEGFWRRQWYPSAGEHRLIFIEDYIKGPADLPLVLKPTVYAAKR